MGKTEHLQFFAADTSITVGVAELHPIAQQQAIESRFGMMVPRGYKGTLDRCDLSAFWTASGPSSTQVLWAFVSSGTLFNSIQTMTGLTSEFFFALRPLISNKFALLETGTVANQLIAATALKLNEDWTNDKIRHKGTEKSNPGGAGSNAQIGWQFILANDGNTNAGVGYVITAEYSLTWIREGARSRSTSRISVIQMDEESGTSGSEDH